MGLGYKAFFFLSLLVRFPFHFYVHETVTCRYGNYKEAQTVKLLNHAKIADEVPFGVSRG